MKYTVKERFEECPQAPWDSAYVFTVLADGDGFVQEFMDADAALEFAAQLNREFAGKSTWHEEALWAFPPANWRRRAAIALVVGVVAGWLLRGAR